MTRQSGRLFRFVGRFGWLLLNLVSLAGTATGLWMLFSRLSDQAAMAALDPALVNRAEIIMAAVGALMIQVFVAGFWAEASNRSRDGGKRLLAAFGGAGFSLCSGVLAAAIWAVVLNLNVALAGLETERRMQPIAKALAQFSARSVALRDTMIEVSVFMQDRKRTEVRSGNSCDGTRAITGEGPRSRMRERLDEEAGERAEAIGAVLADARDAVRLPSRADDAALAASLGRAEAVARDARLAATRLWVERTIADFRGTFDDASYGAFVCRDTGAVALLRRAEALLAEPTALPALPPRAAKADIEMALRNSFTQIMAFAGGWVGLPVTRDPAALNATKPAFIAALAVEAAIIGLTFLLGALDPTAGPIEPKGRYIPRGARGPLASRIALWDGMLREVGGTPIFFVPLDASEERMGAAMAEVARWKMPRMPGGGAVDMSDLAPTIHAGLKGAAGRATTFAVYRVPGRAVEWYRQARIDLADNLPRSMAGM